jgi:hypothetical protein
MWVSNGIAMPDELLTLNPTQPFDWLQEMA